jgi:hypothetical protein
MLPQVDAALAAALRAAGEGDARRRAVAALVGLRRNLCPEAPPALPSPTPA